MGMENNIFWSETRSGFEKPGGKLPIILLRCAPPPPPPASWCGDYRFAPNLSRLKWQFSKHFLLLKKSSFHGKAIWGTTPPLIRVHQESIVLLCSSVICSPVNVLICKEHSNFINEDRKNFRLSKLFRPNEKRVSRVFRTFKLVEQLETKNLRLEIVTRDI